MKFFQDEFRNTAAKQHGEAIVCRDASCSLCHRQVVTCPGEGCTEQTGRVRIGVPGCEIFQMHPENLPCSASLGVGPAKRCCTVHVRNWLICSMQCLRKSNFGKAIAPGDLEAIEPLFAKKMFSIPPMGALLCPGHYKGPAVSEKELQSACDHCGRLNASKSCGACRSVKYVSKRVSLPHRFPLSYFFFSSSVIKSVSEPVGPNTSQVVSHNRRRRRRQRTNPSRCPARFRPNSKRWW